MLQILLNSARLPGFTLTGGDSLVVTESGSQDYLMVRLSGPPSDSVTLCLSINDYCEATILTSSGDAVAASGSCSGAVAQLDFTTDNWSAEQVVVFQGRHDADYTTVMSTNLPEGGNCDSMSSYVGNSTFTVQGSAVSNDSNYSGLAMAEVTGTINDDKDVNSFVTTATHTGDFDGDSGLVGGTFNAVTGDGNGIDEADNFCMDNIPGTLTGTGTYKALLVDGTNRVACSSGSCPVTTTPSDFIDWVLQANHVYFRSDGTTRAMTTVSAGRVFDFSSPTALATNQGFDSGSYWTGFFSPVNWTAGVRCNLWDDDTNLFSGAFGTGSANNTTSLYATPSTCNVPLRLLCIQQ